MSAKLFAHTLACAGLFAVLWIRLSHSTRKPAVIAMMVSAALLGLAPFMYRMGLPFSPRITISWHQLSFVIMMVVWFTPTPTRAALHDPLDEDDGDFLKSSPTTKPNSVSLH